MASTFVIKRTDTSPEGVFGELLDENGSVIAATCEHAFPDSHNWYAPKIPSGTYTCVRGLHHLGAAGTPIETFEITGVEGHSGLLFHPGNSQNDSSGCVLLGSERQGDAVINSRVTFKKFMDLLDGVDTFTLTVVE